MQLLFERDVLRFFACCKLNLLILQIPIRCLNFELSICALLFGNSSIVLLRKLETSTLCHVKACLLDGLRKLAAPSGHFTT